MNEWQWPLFIYLRARYGLRTCWRILSVFVLCFPGKCLYSPASYLQQSLRNSHTAKEKIFQKKKRNVLALKNRYENKPMSNEIFRNFQALMKFPHDYPYSPPSIRFITKVWHPNVYENGDLCISILHPPIDDPQSGELPCERWNPTQSVRTILLSVISLLNEPNTFSPANVDASVMYRRWRDSNGRDNEYPNIIR